MTLDITNVQMVAGKGCEQVVILLPKQTMTPDEALVHAAWLVSVAELHATQTFEDVLKAVQNT